MKIAFTVQYDGSSYVGFQRQKSGPTPQAELERAFSTILRQPVRIYAAGRTDSGVHAAGQVIHMKIAGEIPSLHKLIYGANSLLPPDISVIHGSLVPDSFHARFSCLGREYFYRIINTPYRLALLERHSYWVRFPLNIEAMRIAARQLIGEHDFAAFTPAVYRKQGEKTIRRIDNIRILQRPPEVFVHYQGSGFLHNMIRIITGTLLEIGLGKRESTSMAKIRDKLDRLDSGITLPARGLTFLRAHYRDYATPVELLPYWQLLQPCSEDEV